MSSTIQSLPAPRIRLSRALLKPGNILPAYAWMFLVFNQAMHSSFPPSPSTALLVLIYSVAMVLFIVRRDATRVGSKLDLVIALSGTFFISFLEGPEIQDTRWLPTTVQVIALIGWTASLISLGRSFGIVPADRGLVQHGPYRYLRHPIYAFEELFLLGYLIAVPTPQSAIIIAIGFSLQVVRIIREERILQGYEEYKRKVRWRLVPGIW